MDTPKSSEPKIMFVDLENEVSLKAIELEAKLIFRKHRGVRQIFISTPARTFEFKK